MLPVRVIALPTLLEPADLLGRTAVVFDVMRATTTIATALHADAAAVRVYGSIDDVRRAAASANGRPLLAGEQHCLKPAGFDLGNSPAEYTAARVGGRTICLATTNGTRALVAARTAERLFVGALVNAAATATAIARAGLPITLIASGTQGDVSADDLYGCGAILSLIPDAKAGNDTAHLALAAWRAVCDDVPHALRQCQSAHHLMNANLPGDIEACAAVNALNVVGIVSDDTGVLTVRRA